MHPFGWLFLVVLAVTTATKIGLGLRHARHVLAHRDAVPAHFAAEIGLDAHHKAADYSHAKTQFGLVSTLYEAALVLVLTYGGLLQWVGDIATRWFAPGVLRGVALIIVLALGSTLLDLPFAWYRTFKIEQRFGFNRMTPLLFATDTAKQLAVAAFLGIPLAAGVLWLMDEAGQFWWLYAWTVWVAFNLIILAVYPTWIAPVFNKFLPLTDAQLQDRIGHLLERCGFKAQGIMVMDGSRRSTHGNAYFTGFGKSKRIVFFDTLLERLGAGEIEAILAHELGHFKLRHVFKRAAWIFAASLAFFWLLSWAMGQAWFYTSLGVTDRSTAMALVLFVIVVPQFTFLLNPLASAYSRRHEFEADRYAAQNASAADLVTALVKLYKDNATTLTPDPVHSMFYDSHPPALARISRLQDQAVAGHA
jgi:STE24 endopeptidase